VTHLGGAPAAEVRRLMVVEDRSESAMLRALVLEALVARAALDPVLGLSPGGAAALVEAVASAELAADPVGAHTRRAGLGHEFVPQVGNALRCGVEECGRKKAEHR
jgi:hypothetical protein